MHRVGSWPSSWAILFLLLNKLDGGDRPIGLLPGLYRLWGRLTACLVDIWADSKNLSAFWGTKGRGSVQAVVDSAARAEVSMLLGRDVVQVHFD